MRLPLRPLSRLLLSRLLLCLPMLCGSAPAAANEGDVALGAEFKQPSAADEAGLRAILAAPVPAYAADKSLVAKELAAQQLGDITALLAVYREWQMLSPATLNRGNYANVLMRAGQLDAALQIRRDAIAAAPTEGQMLFLQALYAEDLLNLGRMAQAQDVLDAQMPRMRALGAEPTGGISPLYAKRALAKALTVQVRQDLRVGQADAALTKANQAMQVSREALELARRVSDKRYDQAHFATQGLTLAFEAQVAAAQAGGQFDVAEEALRQYLRFAHEVQLQPHNVATIYELGGKLRMDQREFAVAESLFRQADQTYAGLGYGPLNPRRLNFAQQRLASLEGQRRWPEVQAEFERLDALAQGQPPLQARTRFALERAYANLRQPQQMAQAAALLQGLAQDLGSRYPASHLLVAQANGLRGVALWRLGDAPSRALALPLLQEAVRNYMRPDNLSLQTTGLRPDLRELIFAAALEAAFSSPGAQALDMMAPADWVRGGVVQEALADAAIRSSAADPQLAGLVRQDQDAKHEVQALRNDLAGDAGNAAAPLPAVAAEMRRRIETLDHQRLQWQAQIRQRFPGFDRLVRPPAPSTTELAAALAPDEALLMLLPTADAVYVWALTHDGPHSAARVLMDGNELRALVQRARKTLDFAEMGGRLARFDSAASSSLYQRLLAPLEASIQGKQHLVVAAGGVLGQLPCGVLLTRPVPRADASAPWLIRQAAITHVPSLSAWLAVKQMARAAPASEALGAWGDPQFGPGIGARVAQASAGPGATRQLLQTRASVAATLEQEGPALRYADIPALPETRAELLAIASALQADAAQDLHLGAAASKASVLASSQSGELQRKKVIVFATHGLMAGDLPHLTQPALALAGTGREDRDPLGALLTLDEVLNLQLNADWVLLSACNTAAADGRADEALSGLARGFFYAGSRSLLVTHWAVESESAALLTSHTLQHYSQNPQARKAESLRQAMLSVMQEPRFAHPAFWAPYALVGDGGR